MFSPPPGHTSRGSQGPPNTSPAQQVLQPVPARYAYVAHGNQPQLVTINGQQLQVVGGLSGQQTVALQGAPGQPQQEEHSITERLDSSSVSEPSRPRRFKKVETPQPPKFRTIPSSLCKSDTPDNYESDAEVGPARGQEARQAGDAHSAHEQRTLQPNLLLANPPHQHQHSEHQPPRPTLQHHSTACHGRRDDPYSLQKTSRGRGPPPGPWPGTKRGGRRA